MLRIREGNKFTWAWAIERNNVPVDLSQATELKFSYQFKNRSGRKEIADYNLTGNIITTALLFSGMLGVVNLKLSYMLPVIGLQTVDVDAFEIVGSSEEASEGSEFTYTSDMAIAFQGRNAYQVWLDAGNTGTLEDYFADIKGNPFTYDDFTPAQLEALKVKGDPFLYEDFTPEQIAELQKPATDAAADATEVVTGIEQDALAFQQTATTLINNKMSEVDTAEGLRNTAETTRVQNEQARVTAEGTRQSNETAREDGEDDRDAAEFIRLNAETTRGQNEQGRVTAEGLRVTAEQTRQANTATAITNANNAANNANTKAGLADTAATNANNKATLANDAATLANSKAGLADTAATNANNAASAISPAVINNEQVQAETYNVLNARIAALEAIIAAGVYNYIQADTLVGVNDLQYKGAAMILTGTAAPAIAPDFVGQIFVNTTGGVTYMAKGIASAADWKQTSN